MAATGADVYICLYGKGAISNDNIIMYGKLLFVGKITIWTYKGWITKLPHLRISHEQKYITCIFF